MAGALPVILAPVRTSAVDALLDRLDALCLSGGPDLAPAHYGAAEHPQLGPTEPELDRFELALARRAMGRRHPGAGDLPRHAGHERGARGHAPPAPSRPRARRSSTAGRRRERRPRTTSSSSPAAGSPSSCAARASRSTPSTTRRLADLGSGVRAIGHADDGTVEAVQVDGAGFAFGVQWHAELLVERPEQLALFEALVRAAESSRPATRRRRRDGGRTSCRPGPCGTTDPERPAWTIGLEEEVMLLDPDDWTLAHRIDDLSAEALPRARRARGRRDARLHPRAIHRRAPDRGRGRAPSCSTSAGSLPSSSPARSARRRGGHAPAGGLRGHAACRAARATRSSRAAFATWPAASRRSRCTCT